MGGFLRNRDLLERSRGLDVGKGRFEGDLALAGNSMSADSTLDKSRYVLDRFEERFQVSVLVVPVEKVGHYLHLLSE